MSSGDVMVRMGELATTDDGTPLVSIGLGSCIGLALIDRARGVAGLAHVMLPATPPEGTGGNDGRFADRAVPALIEAVLARGARRTRLEAVLVGGARMFALGSSLDIGARNEAAVREALRSARLPVRAAATRGSTGRTIRVHTDTGIVTVREAGGRDVQIFPEART